MYKRAGSCLKPHLRRLHNQAYTSASATRQSLRTHKHAVAFISTIAIGSIVWYTTARPVYNDAVSPKASMPLVRPATSSDSDELVALVWGSNSSKVLVPDVDSDESIRLPSIAKWLDNVALRDLALHQNHAACVDARGDVYQWGDGFFGDSSSGNRKPKLTLRGKNILQLQLTENKLFALSASGKLYVLSTDASSQELRAGAPTPASDSWWGTGWLWGEDEAFDFAEITPNEKLGWGESFISIAAGQNHLLALTSKGRTYTHPVNKLANQYGQLGFRQFLIPDPASTITNQKTNLLVDLVPKSLADPFANTSRVKRDTTTPTAVDTLPDIDDRSVRFCPHLYELPVLRGVDVTQVAAGGRSSFVRTKTGRVLGWGANEYGQIGLGSNVALDTITVPTEVILWRMIPVKTRSKCLDVAAGGDLTAFAVERSTDGSPATTDLLMCGNGQHGGLGNNSYSNAQSTPVRTKNISGLLQYSDQKDSLQPIIPEDIAISPTGHVLVALGSSADSGGIGGRDLMVWGKNYNSELGNGKKASLAIPMSMENPDGERFMLRRKQAREVRDLKGRVWKRGVKVEQQVAVGYGNSAVYWKIAPV